ncbi:MAG: hypothetical protein E6H39_00250, partial [Betaproteobacteria bacterium]
MAAFPIGAKPPLRLIVVLLALLASAAALAADVWEAHTGDPCCGLPDAFYKYPDANEACRKEAVLGPDTQCVVTFRDTLRNDAGPQTRGACVVDNVCLCGDCIIGSPGDPRNFHSGVFAGKFTGKRPQSCGGLREFLSLCYVDTPKAKGIPDAGLCKANPCNVATGNKFQAEPIYRTATGSLQLQISYNNQPGSSYFQSSPFGMRWNSRYLTRVRDSGQGIVGVDRPDGRELEFRAPVSGNVYVTDAD